MRRRSVFKLFGALSASSLLQPSQVLRAMGQELEKSVLHFQQLDASDNSEDFWLAIRQAYTVSPTIINLNNGGVAPAPKVVQDAVAYYNRLSNEIPSHYMWHVLDKGREQMRQQMADLAGCHAEELAFNRNSSEGLETIIFGLRLKAGDEVLLTKQDYPNMIHAWKQREKRDGIVLKWLNFEFPIESEDDIAQQFISAFTPRTKVVHLTHMINWNGQVLPVKTIADAAHDRGIEVVVDGAHTFAHLPFRIDELHCDYFATSLHKWLSAPIGSGLLYVRKDKIKNLYPLLAPQDPESESITKFEALGTRSFPIEFGIRHAIEFFQGIGAEKKYNRLYELREYWMKQLEHHPKIRFNTPRSRMMGGAIGNFSIEGKTPTEISTYLFEKHSIHTVAIDWENIHGVRITPNVYTLKSELDQLVKAVLQLAG